MTTTITIGMLGLGTVGSGVVQRLTQAATKIEQTQHLRLRLAAVAVNHLRAPRAVTLPFGTRLTDSIASVVTDPQIQLVIEVMGTVATAKAAIITALKHGKSVVTANKDLIAQAGLELVALAHRQHCDLLYEASVAGGIPILRTLTDSYVTDQVTGVAGIINGTANYILTAMSAGQPYQQALTAAQQAGYAEADPTNDVSGLDTAYKLMILSQFAFGQPLTLTQVAPKGLTQVTAWQCQQATAAGFQIKLLAQAQRYRQRLYCRVAPVAVAKRQALGQVAGVQNAVAVTSQAIGDSLYTGPGAGSTATANSVLNDVMVAAQNYCHQTRGQAFNRNQAQLTVAPLAALPQAYLLVTTAATALKNVAVASHCTLTPKSPMSYQTSPITTTQLSQLKRAVGPALTALPIAFSTVATPVVPRPIAPVHVAI